MKTHNIYGNVDFGQTISANNAKRFLCNINWTIFEIGCKSDERLIFLEDGNILYSVNGNVTKYQWIIPTTGVLIISEGNKTKLYNVKFIDHNLLVLQLDTTNEFLILIEKEGQKHLSLNEIEDVMAYMWNKVAEGYAPDEECNFIPQSQTTKAFKGKESIFASIFFFLFTLYVIYRCVS